MKTIRIYIITFFISLLILSCSEEDTVLSSNVSLELQAPANLPKNAQVDLSTAVLILHNVNTGAEVEYNYPLPKSIRVEDGLYNIDVKGASVSYHVSYMKKKDKITKDVTNELRALQRNIEIKGGELQIKVSLFMQNKNQEQGFVISEIFFSRTTTPDKKSYDGDSFIEIYNNSDETLYADGLCVASSHFQVEPTTALESLNPDFRNEKVAVGDVYRVPGSGKEHPVKPGETFVLCDVAINHKNENPNSIDLSEANFEWFDGLGADDVDVPEVPNLDPMIQHDSGSWVLPVNGNSAFILFRLPKEKTAKQFMEESNFSFEHLFFGMTLTQDVWGIPNSQIMDAVQCAKPSDFEWSVLDPSLDISWTYSVESSPYNGLSVKRKISHKDGKRIVLQDTNDSATDFVAKAPNPSPGKVEDHQ